MPAQIEKGLSRRLRQAIEIRGLSQVDLAKGAQASTAAVSQWLRGTKQPTRENVKALAQLLDVDPEWLEYSIGSGPEPDEKTERQQYKSCSGWRMRTAPVDGGRDYGNPIFESFAPDLGTMVREGVQNVLDVIVDAKARVVFRVIRLHGSHLSKFLDAMNWSALRDHLEAASAVQQRHGRLLKAALAEFDSRQEMLILVVEDSGTSGLIGDEYSEGNFTALVRNNLDSSKTTATAGGAIGIGKAMWWIPSQFNAVLFNSDLSLPTSEGKQDIRIIGRCELPWHQDSDADEPCAGPGWFGRISKKDNIEVAESFWGNRTLAGDLFIDRAHDLGPGTTICVVGFHDPSSDEPKDARALADNIEAAIADYFWPAIADGKLEARVETWEGRELKSQVEVDVSSHLPSLVDCLAKLKTQDLQEQLQKPSDVIRRDVTLSVPARTTADGKHPAFDHKAILMVRRAGDDDDKWVNHLAMYRGPRMVVEYQSLRNYYPGAVPFHAVLICGEAASNTPDGQDVKTDRFLRTAEPQAHNKWTMTPDLKANYARGGKKAIDDMLTGARRQIGELVRPAIRTLDDGPQALKELLRIGDDETPPPERPRIYRPLATLDAEGRWVVDGRIRVRPDEQQGWKMEPVVVFDVETGGGQPVDWLELEPLMGCTLENGKLVMEPGINEARFRGVTDSESHPILAAESAIRLELRRIEPWERTES